MKTARKLVLSENESSFSFEAFAIELNAIYGALNEMAEGLIDPDERGKMLKLLYRLGVATATIEGVVKK